MRTAPLPTRSLCAAAFALLLALRSLAPSGFMPAFDHGTLTIVVCPDASGAVVPTMHHHHPADHSGAHHPCPYAAASSLGAVGADSSPAAAPPLLFAPAVVLGRAFAFVSARSARERPPLRGPPLLA